MDNGLSVLSGWLIMREVQGDEGSDEEMEVGSTVADSSLILHARHTPVSHSDDV